MFGKHYIKDWCTWPFFGSASGSSEDEYEQEEEEEEEQQPELLKIYLPCQPSEYIHNICFQFIQILLMIITQQSVPSSILRVLEMEFRLATAKQLRSILHSFLMSQSSLNNSSITESFALQLYFDVSFARSIFEKNVNHISSSSSRSSDSSVAQLHGKNGVISGGSGLWQEMLEVIADQHIDIVTMNYIEVYLKREICQSLNGCLLMYGAHHPQQPALSTPMMMVGSVSGTEDGIIKEEEQMPEMAE